MEKPSLYTLPQDILHDVDGCNRHSCSKLRRSWSQGEPSAAKFRPNCSDVGTKLSRIEPSWDQVEAKMIQVSLCALRVPMVLPLCCRRWERTQCAFSRAPSLDVLVECSVECSSQLKVCKQVRLSLASMNVTFSQVGAKLGRSWSQVEPR